MSTAKYIGRPPLLGGRALLPLLLLDFGLLFNVRLNPAAALAIKRHSGQVYAFNENRKLRTQFFNTRQADHRFTLKDA